MVLWLYRFSRGGRLGTGKDGSLAGWGEGVEKGEERENLQVLENECREVKHSDFKGWLVCLVLCWKGLCVYG